MSISKDLRHHIYRRDKYRCQSCGVRVRVTDGTLFPDSATLEHIVPKFKGGKNKPDNLVTWCFICNNAENKMRQKLYPELSNPVLRVQMA